MCHCAAALFVTAGGLRTSRLADSSFFGNRFGSGLFVAPEVIGVFDHDDGTLAESPVDLASPPFEWVILFHGLLLAVSIFTGPASARKTLGTWNELTRFF